MEKNLNSLIKRLDSLEKEILTLKKSVDYDELSEVLTKALNIHDRTKKLNILITLVSVLITISTLMGIFMIFSLYQLAS